MDCSFEGLTSRFRGRFSRLHGLRRHHILKFYSFQFMGEYVCFFLQLSARNIHLLSRYPAAGEYGGPQLGFDDIWMPVLKGIKLLKLDSVANHCPKRYYCRFTLN